MKEGQTVTVNHYYNKVVRPDAPVNYAGKRVVLIRKRVNGSWIAKIENSGHIEAPPEAFDAMSADDGFIPVVFKLHGDGTWIYSTEATEAV